MRRRYREKVYIPLMNFLRQGITPEKLALAVTIGTLVGLSPLLGLTTIICGLLAWLLRLNWPATLLMCWVVAPLQLLLMPPFIEAGEYLFTGRSVFSMQTLTRFGDQSWWISLSEIGYFYLRGGLVWFVLAIPVGVALYYVSRYLFRQALGRHLAAGRA